MAGYGGRSHLQSGEVDAFAHEQRMKLVELEVRQPHLHAIGSKSEAIGCDRKRSEAIRSDQKQSEAIRSNQKRPEAIRSDQKRSEGRTRASSLGSSAAASVSNDQLDWGRSGEIRGRSVEIGGRSGEISSSREGPLSLSRRHRAPAAPRTPFASPALCACARRPPCLAPRPIRATSRARVRRRHARPRPAPPGEGGRSGEEGRRGGQARVCGRGR